MPTTDPGKGPPFISLQSIDFENALVWNIKFKQFQPARKFFLMLFSGEFEVVDGVIEPQPDNKKLWHMEILYWNF